MGDSMLACLDLAQFQLRNGGVIDPSFQARGFQRIDVELTAKIGQCI
jgi:hypothetical protein